MATSSRMVAISSIRANKLDPATSGLLVCRKLRGCCDGRATDSQLAAATLIKKAEQTASLNGHHSFHVARDQINLKVDLRTRLEVPERRCLNRMRNQVDGNL